MSMFSVAFCRAKSPSGSNESIVSRKSCAHAMQYMIASRCRPVRTTRCSGPARSSVGLFMVIGRGPLIAGVLPLLASRKERPDEERCQPCGLKNARVLASQSEVRPPHPRDGKHSFPHWPPHQNHHVSRAAVSPLPFVVEQRNVVHSERGRTSGCKRRLVGVIWCGHVFSSPLLILRVLSQAVRPVSEASPRGSRRLRLLCVPSTESCCQPTSPRRAPLP